MAKPKLGTKRTCLSCEAKFYDLLRNPVICPKCQATFVVAGTEKAAPQRAAARPAPAKEKAEAKAKAAEAAKAKVKAAKSEAEPQKNANEDDDDDDNSDDDEIPAEIADVDVEVEDEDENENEQNTFLNDDQEGSGDVSDIVGDVSKKEEEG